MRILSIDGGGILGCGPSHYLKQLEAQVPGKWEHAQARIWQTLRDTICALAHMQILRIQVFGSSLYACGLLR